MRPTGWPSCRASPSPTRTDAGSAEPQRLAGPLVVHSRGRRGTSSTDRSGAPGGDPRGRHDGRHPGGSLPSRCCRRFAVSRQSSRPTTSRSTRSAGQATPDERPEHVNEVRLVGRLAAEPVRRLLPSGDELVSFRLVVDRPVPSRAERGSVGRSGGGVRNPTVDTLDCAAWRGDVQRVLSRATAGDVLEVRGALRRRFWRSPTGPASRSEVEATRVRRVRALRGSVR